LTSAHTHTPKQVANANTVARNHTPPAFLQTHKASSTHHQNRAAALQTEMLKECTFSPQLRALPSSYGKPKLTGTFDKRSEVWHDLRATNLEIAKLEKEEKEMEGCTFAPALPGKKNRESELRKSGVYEETNADANGNTNSEETVRRLYYIETMKLKERREFEAKEHERKLDEEFTKSCTFQPNLAGSLIHNLQHRHDNHTHINARYLEQSTATAERRKAALRNPDIASPGPGEYEEDVSNDNGRVFEGYDDMLNAFGSNGFAMRNTNNANDSTKKSWSFKPRVNELHSKMSVAKEYVSQDVIQRLTKSGRPEHIHALQKGYEDENDVNASSMSEKLRNKEEAKRDFHEFLARQNALQIKRKEKAEQLKDSEKPSFVPSLCENSEHIHAANNRGSFMQRVTRDEQKRETLIQQQQQKASMCPAECTFRPAILRKSSEREVRSVEALSYGDAEMREISNRALRLKVEAEELSRYSFKPNVGTGFAANPKKDQPPPKGKLQIHHQADSYVARVAEYKSQKMEKLLNEKKARDEAELAECTGVPKTISCPEYVKRIAHSMQISKKYREKTEGKGQVAVPSWK
jgi:hypothetical protein